MKRKYSIGVDIGGSHITSAVVDLDTRELVEGSQATLSVDNRGEKDDIIRRWSEAISASIAKVPGGELAGIGFAMPGPFDYEKGICLIKGVPKYEKLYGTDIGEAIRNVAGISPDLPVRFINDASAFAVGEAWAGKTAGFEKSVAITLGTGFGSAFVDSKVPVVTGESVPDLGCVYHIKFGEGIADDYFSTRWFTSRYKEITGRSAEGVKEIAAMAEDDSSVKELFSVFGTNLGRFLSPWLLKFGAEALVIGGNISRAYHLFGNSMAEALFDEDCRTEVFISDLMEESALYGSAFLLDEDYWLTVKDTLKHM